MVAPRAASAVVLRPRFVETGCNDRLSDSRFLGYATSPDGLAWTRWPGNPLTRDGWVEDISIVKHDIRAYIRADRQTPGTSAPP